MRKLMTLALALVLMLCLCACNQTPEVPVVTEFTFPEGTSILGVNISGLNHDAGWKAMQEAVNSHTLTITVDGVEASVSAQEIGLTCSRERYDAIADALEAGASVDYTGLISFNEGKLRALVNQHFNKPVTEAAIVFDEETGEYVLTADAIGQVCNPNALVGMLKEHILKLDAAPVLTDVSQIIEPTIRDEDEAVTAALETVNNMHAVELTYTFTADGETSTHTIPAETIRSLITLGPDNVTPGINQYALESYVAELSDTFSAGSTQGAFQTTGGGTVNLTVSYNGVYLDQEAMAEDLATCITEGISGERTAPFQASGIRDMAYGGTYIEVNLSSQYLWFYKHGECILSTSFVSGKVSTGHITPNGVFSIYSKEQSVYLEGDDYRTFVNYWMPFYGGYGLHDATWRGSFGGDIYLYGGSHGCVNLPLSVAAAIYNNASVGTKVIVYGGRTSVPPQPQSLGGTTSYSVAEDAGTITLDIRPRYSGPSMSYSSSNSSVASVSSGGVVTIKGVGTAVITVSVPSYGGYTSATTSVTISVHSTCDEGRHKLGKPTTVTPATCQPGLEKVNCTKCDYSEENELKATASHKFTTYTQTLAPTCGAEGKEVSTCDTCGKATDEKTIAATNQHTPGDPQITKEPNCTETGISETKCTGCGQTMSTETVGTDANKHIAGEPTITAATCTTDGSKEIFCTLCSKSLSTEVIPAGHTGIVEEGKNPTCTESGYYKKNCTSCGTVFADETYDATGHSYSGGVCSSCGGADPNYVPPAPSTEPSTTPEA